MSHKLKAEGKTAYPFSALANPSARACLKNKNCTKRMFYFPFS